MPVKRSTVVYKTITVLLLLSVSGQDSGRSQFVFNLDRRSLAECIENHDLLRGSWNYLRTVKVTTSEIADLAASVFSGYSIARKDYYNLLSKVESFIGKSPCTDVADRKKLTTAVEKVLEDCSDPMYVSYRFAGSGDIAASYTRVPLPTFENEPVNIGAVLDYVLADWQITPSEMIREATGDH